MTRLLPLLLLLVACGSDTDIRDLYFPVRGLTDGRVYVYDNTGTLPGPPQEYWYYLGIDQDTALYLTATHYGPDFSPDQMIRERVTNRGMELVELTLLQTDSNGLARPTPTEILFDRVFPFELSDPSEPSGYRISFQNGDATTYVTLNRRYLRDTTVTVPGGAAGAGVTVHGGLFELRGEVSLRDPVDGDISPTFTGYEIYGEGIGLVEYFRDLGAAGTLGGKLRERLTMPQFEARVR